jgi:hypothetical protein
MARRNYDFARWPSLMPLGDVGDVPPFPVEALPTPLESFVVAAAEQTRTPVDLVVGFALGALATVTAGRADVSPWPGWVEPVNLWTAPIASPGEGKSPAFSVAVAPILAVEASLRDRKGREVAEAQTLRRIEEQRLSDAEREAARAKAQQERMSAEEMARALAAALAEHAEPHIPELFATDCTPEAIEDALADNRGRFAWLSDEAGLFTMAAGRYTREANPQNFLTAWSGGPLKAKRIGRRASVPRAVLSVSCAVQPVMLTRATRHAELIGTGFLDRFLFLMPRSIVGYRSSSRTPDRSVEMAQWEWTITRLFDALDPLPSPRQLVFDAKAEAGFVDWRERTEEQRRPDGLLAPVVQWSTKLDGQFTRLAGLLTLVDDANATTITAEIVDRVVELLDYFAHHARAAFALAGADGPMAIAREVAAWIVAGNRQTFTRRECFRAFDHRIATVGELEPILELLTEYGYIRLSEPEVAAGRGRPSIVYEVNPSLFPPRTQRT